jgi:hypothetical protein
MKNNGRRGYQMLTHKEYIGDAVYVGYDGFAIVLTTEDGVSVTNEIVLEPEIWALLLDYVKRLKERDANQK